MNQGSVKIMFTQEFPGIDEYMSPFRQFFSSKKGVKLADNYVVGLMMDGERKSVEPMSERVNASERSMQRLLTEVKWDNARVFAEYRRQMLSMTSASDGVLVLDDTGFPKKGRHSACVARQYCGATGKIDNCQIGVSLTYVGQGLAWPYAMDLFVPESWDASQSPDCIEKRRDAHIPDEVHYRQKWQIALEQVDLARKDGVPHQAIVADAWYGDIPGFRKALEERNEHYVLGIHSDTNVFTDKPVFDIPEKGKRGRPRKYPELSGTTPEPVKVSDLGKNVKEDEWIRYEIRKDCAGKPLVVEALTMRVSPSINYKKGIVNEEVRLIIERRKQGKDEYELRYFVSNLPADKPFIEILRLSHERFWIEQGYQQLKEELGLDHHEGRSWTGWHRHMLLTFLAYGYLLTLRVFEKKHTQPGRRCSQN